MSKISIRFFNDRIAMQFTEHNLELSIMELFENEGYTHRTGGGNIHREKSDVLLPELLVAFLRHRYAPDF